MNDESAEQRLWPEPLLVPLGLLYDRQTLYANWHALNHVLDLSIPEAREEGGTMVIPGHGRLGDSADVGYYRDMCTVIRDRIQDMVNRGMTLAQVKADKKLANFDLVRNSRLSIMKVTDEQWEIMEGMTRE